MLSKKREIFINIYKERLNKIEELSKKDDYDNLKYIVKSSAEEFAFDKLEDAMAFLNDIRTGKICIIIQL